MTLSQDSPSRAAMKARKELYSQGSPWGGKEVSWAGTCLGALSSFNVPQGRKTKVWVGRAGGFHGGNPGLLGLAIVCLIVTSFIISGTAMQRTWLVPRNYPVVWGGLGPLS